MTDFLVCDTEKEDMNSLKEDCFDYCFEKNYEVEVYGFSRIEEAQGYISGNSVRTTYMLACGEVVDNLISGIRQRNRDNYVVLVAAGLKDLVTYTNPTVRPVGCLMKPVSMDDVSSVIDSIGEVEENDMTRESTFCFKIHSREYYLECSRIVMLEAVSKKLVVYTDTQEYEFYDSLSHAQEQLPDTFVRCHKSFIVNIAKVVTVDYKNMEIQMKDELTADLSRTQKTEFMNRIAEWQRR